MDYEPFNYKAEQAAYREDVAAMREEARIVALEEERIQWAQNNGNDSGFDPYWAL